MLYRPQPRDGGLERGGVGAEGGGAVDPNAGTPAWKIWLIVLDVVVFAACAAGIAVPVVLYLRGRKQGRQP